MWVPAHISLWWQVAQTTELFQTIGCSNRPIWVAQLEHVSTDRLTIASPEYRYPISFKLRLLPRRFRLLMALIYTRSQP